jgi:ribonuclease BN (tRNA processing enzyme)
MALADGVDMLIHDAQHTATEFAAVKGCSHSAVEYAVGLAERAGARRLMLFDHDPRRHGDEIDAIVAGCEGHGVPVEAAAEGRVLSLP